MDADGILNACTTNCLIKSAMTAAIRNGSTYSFLMDLLFLLSCCESDIIPPVKRIRSMQNVECKLKIAKWGARALLYFFILHFALCTLPFPCHSPILSTAR